MGWAQSDFNSRDNLGLKTSFFQGHQRVVNNGGDYPYSTVGEIFEQTGEKAQRCSGTLVGRYFALTACHCVFLESGNVPKRVYFFPRTKEEGFGAPVPVVAAFGKHGCLGNYPQDFALAVLSKPLGDRYGYLKISALPQQAAISSDYHGRLVSVGFPGDSNENRIVDPACSLKSLENGYYLTDCSTEPGDSGGPILIPEDGGRYSIIAIKVAVKTPETHGGKYSEKNANMATALSGDAGVIEQFIQDHDNSRALSDLISNGNSGN